MSRSLLAVAGLLVTGVIVAAGCGSKSSSSTPAPSTPAAGTTTTSPAGSPVAVLDGTVGPGFTIALTKGGAPVTTLAVGTYTLNVDDEADIHDFHLTGPGVDVSTDVAFTGKKSFTITLKAGTYHFQCDPHAGSMNGDFTVS
jgi:copper binding plastocyanin/azurin family protein